MEGAGFEVALTRARARARRAPTRSSSCSRRTPACPPAPLRETASGGELSRVMLALLGVASDGSQATLVFDEVDAGIGGKTARAVGERLRALARAGARCCASRTCRRSPRSPNATSRSRRTRAPSPALTTVSAARRAQVVGELVRMLGADADDVRRAARHAQASSLRRRA